MRGKIGGGEEGKNMKGYEARRKLKGVGREGTGRCSYP